MKNPTNAAETSSNMKIIYMVNILTKDTVERVNVSNMSKLIRAGIAWELFTLKLSLDAVVVVIVVILVVVVVVVVVVVIVVVTIIVVLVVILSR